MACLSPEVLSFINYTELNSSEWRDNIIQEIIKHYIFDKGHAKNAEIILTDFLGHLNPGFSLEDIERCFKKLAAKKNIFSCPDGYVLAQAENARIAENIGRARNDLSLDKELFFKLCEKHGLGAEYEKVYEHFILAFYQSLKVSGATIFKAISEKDLKKTDWPKRFCEKFPEEVSDKLLSIMTEYFTNLQPFSRNRILGAMRFYLFYGASGLSSQALQLLNKGKVNKKIILLLDTNFIFSLLDLHYHTQNEAVKAVLRFAKKAGKDCDIRFKYISSTLDEAKEVLNKALKNLSRSQIRPNMYSMAAQAYPEIERAILEKANKKGVYCIELLKDYIAGLKSILSEMDINEYNVYPHLCESEAVQNDLEKEEQFQLSLPETKRKPLEAITHDICFWHSVDKERGRTGKEFVEIGIWGATIDKWLLAFDQRKRGYREFSPPRVLFPISLLQILHFWIPNNREFEDCLLQSITRPFFSIEFSKEEEETTRKIIDTISRFEKADEISKETISSLLGNRALHAKIADADKTASEELIESALFDENNKLANQCENLQEQLLYREKEKIEFKHKIDQQIADLTRTLDSTHIEKAKTKELLEQAESEIKVRDAQIDTLSTKNEELTKFKNFVCQAFCTAVMILLPLGITYLINYLFINQMITPQVEGGTNIKYLYNLGILTISWFLCGGIVKLIFRKNSSIVISAIFNVATSPFILEMIRIWSNTPK